MNINTLLVIQHIQILALVLLSTTLLSLKLSIPWRASQDSTPEHVQPHTVQSNGDLPTTYDRVVVMLVDALREDMLFERPEMEFVRSLVSSQACTRGFVAQAHNPTVTMPRIKAITSGGVPQFIDALNNLDSGALEEDNLIQRLHQAGNKLVLYGDETWLKLFPGRFHRHDGTSSFFTKDYTQVDDNVTRHFTEDFDPTWTDPKSRDWDAVVLHYLGLDHIGHQFGPDAPQMHLKLKEMDRAFRQLHAHLLQQERLRNGTHPTLLLLLSDHGMNQGGNHGGATAPETSAVAVFVHVEASLACDVESLGSSTPGRLRDVGMISQVDLAPTLGLLLGVGIPSGSVGAVVPEVLNLGKHGSVRNQRNGVDDETPPSSKTSNGDSIDSGDGTNDHNTNILDDALRANLAQLVQLHRDKVSNPDPGLAASCSILDDVNDFEVCIKGIQDELQSELVGGQGHDGQLRIGVGVATLVGASAFVLAKTRLGAWMWDTSSLRHVERAVLVLGIVFHMVALTSSSAIENEYVIWFHFGTAWAVLRLASLGDMHGQRHVGWLFNAVAVLVVIRVLRSRLQVINFATLNPLPKPSFVNENTALLEVPALWQGPAGKGAVLAGYWLFAAGFRWCTTTTRTTTRSKISQTWAQVFASGMAVIGIGFLKGVLPSLGEVHQEWGLPRIVLEAYVARSVLCGVAVVFVLDVLESRCVRQDYFELLVLLLHRGTNTAIVVGLVVVMRLVASQAKLTNSRSKDHASRRVRNRRANDRELENTKPNDHELENTKPNDHELENTKPNDHVCTEVLALWTLGQCGFFCLGNSHSISTVDISGAYTGLLEYNQWIVGGLTTVITYTGPLLGFVNIATTASSHGSPQVRRGVEVIVAMNTVRLVVATAVMVLMRTHLFVWSVFAPKWGYEVLMFVVSAFASDLVMSVVGGE